MNKNYAKIAAHTFYDALIEHTGSTTYRNWEELRPETRVAWTAVAKAILEESSWEPERQKYADLHWVTYPTKRVIILSVNKLKQEAEVMMKDEGVTLVHLKDLSQPKPKVWKRSENKNIPFDTTVIDKTGAYFSGWGAKDDPEIICWPVTEVIKESLL